MTSCTVDATMVVCARAHLAALCGREPAGGLIELRFRRPGGAMRQRFYPTRRAQAVAHTAVHLARKADVYVGCAPRRRRAGGRWAIERAWALWVDCDTTAAVDALADFEHPPSLVVRSGSARNSHAYWLLQAPISPHETERYNLRLAGALGADRRAYDAARVLRVAGTKNHKHHPPPPVLIDRATGERYDAHRLAAELPDIEGQLPRSLRGDEAQRSDGADPLLALEPAFYVQALTGLRPGRAGKVCCPFHSEHTPSLHVYADAARGWYCFGCGRGGSVYDLAAALWGRDTRGADFLILRRELHAALGMAP